MEIDEKITDAPVYSTLYPILPIHFMLSPNFPLKTPNLLAVRHTHHKLPSNTSGNIPNPNINTVVDDSDGLGYVPGEIIIKFRSEVSEEVSIKSDTLYRAIRSGRLVELEKKLTARVNAV